MARASARWAFVALTVAAVALAAPPGGDPFGSSDAGGAANRPKWTKQRRRQLHFKDPAALWLFATMVGLAVVLKFYSKSPPLPPKEKMRKSA